MNKQIGSFQAEISLSPSATGVEVRRPGYYFLTGKRIFDICLALIGLPITGMIALLLLCVNPIWNPGPLFYSQLRMGRDCRPFRAYKFRTMRCSNEQVRGPNDPVEIDRITPLGHFLRRTRFDEWPQFLNVLLGQMSFIGPRPDYWEHALHYTETIPEYRQRHVVQPGITGLAQVDGGYAEGIEATIAKTRIDLWYIRNASLATDWYVFWRTVKVVLTGYGAR